MHTIARHFIISITVLLCESHVLAADAVDAMPPKFIADVTIEGKASRTGIIWGNTTNGITVGISSVTTSLLFPIWPSINVYLESLGSKTTSWGNLSRSMFILELDGQLYSEQSYGGKRLLTDENRLGPISVDTAWFHKIEKAVPYQIIYDTAPAPILTEGRHSLRVFYKSDQKLLPGPLLSILVKLRPYPMQNGVREIERALSDWKSNLGPYQVADLAVRMRMVGARDALVTMLKNNDQGMRQAAASALGVLGNDTVIPTLKDLAVNDVWIIRNTAIESLVKLGEPFKVSWAEPIIKSKDPAAFQNAIWLVRKYAGEDALATLIRCLDMNDPSVKNYYNYTLVSQIGACGGPQLKYYHDFDGKGTPEQVEENRKTLDKMKNWSR